MASLLFVAMCTTALAAGLSIEQPKLLPPEQAFRFSARALDAATLEARFDIADGYYLYRDKLHFAVDRIGGLSVALPPGQRKHDEFFGDVETYRGAVVLRLPLPTSAARGTVTLHADSQGCADAGVCYPPNPQQVELTVPAPGAPPGTYVDARRKKTWFK